MTFPLVSLVAMTFAVTSMVVALAMFFLVLWQSPRRAENQIMSLYMLEVVLWGAMAFMLRASRSAGLDATPFFYGIVMGIGFNGLLLFAVAAQVAGLWRRWALLVFLGGLVFLTVNLPALFGGQLYTGFGISLAGQIKFQFQPMGYVVFGVAYLFYVLSIITLWRHRDGAAGGLLPGSVIISLGALTSLHPVLSQYSFAIMTAGITTTLFAHNILSRNLFNPLMSLNRELAEANARLSRLTIELKATNEQLVEASHLKSNFLASMSHELRTPLNSIMGYTDMLMQGIYGDVTETQLDRLEVVLRSSRHLLDLINDVLDLSKIEAGQMNLTIHPMDIAPVIEECLTIFVPLAEKKGLRLEREVAIGIPPVLADRGRLVQTLVNLIGNAVKFTEKGEVILHAREAVPDDLHSVSLPTAPKGWILLIVQDTGIGISPADQQIIFDEFRQADSSATRTYEGTGLGLAITRRLARMMNGDVWVESEVGRGSKFYLALPLAAEELVVEKRVEG